MGFGLIVECWVVYVCIYIFWILVFWNGGIIGGDVCNSERGCRAVYYDGGIVILFVC